MSSIELMPVSALRPAFYNPREADAKRLELVRLSLRKLGFLLPLVATADGEILSGHQRHHEAVGMGAAKVPVMRVDVRALAGKLPDIPVDSPAFYPCMAAEMRDVLPLARKNMFRFVRHAANVGRMLARLHVDLPIVATPGDEVINGMGRLEAAARKGRKQIAVVTLDEDKAALATAMLNLLSMDFRFTGENADFLRYGSFRREWLRRTFLGTAFVLPVYRHKRLSDVRLDEIFMARWKAVCGESVLDFGCGQGDEARMLREAGIRVTEFEPYPAEKNTVSREKGRVSALGFLSAVRAGTEFSAIFISSVFNSVPFPEDREHILRVVAALCGPETLVCATARGTKSSAWGWVTENEALSERASRGCNFPLGMEKGVVLGDLTAAPKVQKFYDEEEFRDLFARHFGTVETGQTDGMVTARCRKPLHFGPRDLAESLRFEFNLPYPDGKRMGLVQQALDAFSVRLGLPLGDV